MALLAAELLAAPDELLVVLAEHQAAELASVDAAAELEGERRTPGRKAIEDRHRREQRQVRTDKLQRWTGDTRLGIPLPARDRESAGAPGRVARRSV